ncbi:ribosomal protein S18 acetylase RimI-like enzyme [Sinobacterium caligoides]|uniref:Ribosomal protein S18 acetylase RimI-like enzyme n=1 Tax=Sinobacterium caligoides TaxID=933926 RepID=A0A3N2DDZ5_9GAMM|nr:N-acetyltransferase [Sinobacterium caligoides]ROR98010.1 ribosomal protein S18 acetylase RimI-like enzyme [Sinobacterium caligoides]
MTVRLMKEVDIDGTALVHQEAFTRQEKSREWLSCTANAFPRMLCYIIESEGQTVGYIIWAQKSGFRPEVVLELEQIAIHPSFQGNGFGQDLIERSLQLVKSHLTNQGSKLKHILVSTREDNDAQKLYRRVLGAEVEATISNLFSANEVYMVARNV